MIATLLPPLTFAAAIGAGLNAGLFFIFSVCIMTALGRLPAEQGIAAMQSINAVIQNPVFLAVFMGTTVLAAVLVICGFALEGSARVFLIAGGLLFVTGMFIVTILFNVPMNNRLDAIAPTSSQAAALWADYLVTWVRWNHVRTLSSFGALACFVMAFRSH